MLCIQACKKMTRMLGGENGRRGRKDQFSWMKLAEQRPTSRSALNSTGSFICFGSRYNGFAQLNAHNNARKDNETPNPSSVVVLWMLIVSVVLRHRGVAHFILKVGAITNLSYKMDRVRPYLFQFLI